MNANTNFGFNPSASNGVGGKTIKNILSIDGNDGLINFQINYSDGSQDVATHSLVSDQIIGMDTLQLQSSTIADVLNVKDTNGDFIFRASQYGFGSDNIVKAYNAFQVNRKNTEIPIFEIDKLDKIKMILPDASTLSLGMRSVLMNIATGQLAYEASFEIAANGTRTFFDDAGNVIQEFTITNGSTGINWTIDTFNSTTDTVSNVAATSYSTAVGTAKNLTTQASTYISPSIFNVFKKK